MKAYTQLAPREKWLIKIAGVLILIFGIWQFALSPVINTVSRAKLELTSAERDYDIVNRGLPAISNTSNTPKAVFDRNAAVYAAQLSQITISRIQPTANGTLQIWLEDSPTQNVYSFLSEINRLYDVKTQRAKLIRRSDGLVSAQFTFAPL